MRIAISSASRLTDLAREIERTCAPLHPSDPLELPAFPSTALPDATPQKRSPSLIWVSDLSLPAVCHDGHWYRLNLGASI